MSLLGEEANRRVSEAVARAEARTSGEVVVAVIGRSAEYVLERGLFALALTFVLVVEGASWLHQGPIGPFVWPVGFPLLLLACFRLARVPTILRLLVPRAVRQKAVSERTKIAFLDLGVSETKGRSGVLILVSEAERRVELLADRGIYERVPAERFRTLVSELSGALRRGEAQMGLVTAVEAVGEMLSSEFPIEADDVNELPDGIRRLDP